MLIHVAPAVLPPTFKCNLSRTNYNYNSPINIDRVESITTCVLSCSLA